MYPIVILTANIYPDSAVWFFKELAQLSRMKRILYVESDEDTGHAVRQILSSSGFSIDVVQTLSEAMLYSSRYYDLILINAVLPDTDPITVFRNLKVSTGNTPTFALTGILPLSSGEIAQMKHEGIADYIQKPFTRADLLSRLGKLLEAR
jgi:DNA-binding response OmpR family regulator